MRSKLNGETAANVAKQIIEAGGFFVVENTVLWLLGAKRQFF